MPPKSLSRCYEPFFFNFQKTFQEQPVQTVAPGPGVGGQYGDWGVSPTSDLGVERATGFANPLCLGWGTHEQYLGNI